MLLLLARHGETEWNVAKRIQGWGDSPLTDTGIRQATLLANRLESEEISAIYCSDLKRANDTARIIAADRVAPVECITDLREMGWGRWEGKTAEEIAAVEPERWARFLARGTEVVDSDDEGWELTTAVPGGETVADASLRVKRALERILHDHPGDDEKVVVVGHGGSLRFFFTLALGLAPRYIRRFHLSNASLSSISYSPIHPPIIRSINDTGHHEVENA